MSFPLTALDVVRRAAWVLSAALFAGCGGGGGPALPGVQVFGESGLPTLPLATGELEADQTHLQALSAGGINLPPYSSQDYRNTGNGVRVAMLDTSIQIRHPDLAERVVRAYDFIDWDEDPSPALGSTVGWHGTATAGLVAASANGLGVRGVAPLASLFAYRVIADDANQRSGALHLALADALSASAQVVNNSWTHQDNDVLTAVDSEWLAAMANGVTLTRGPVVVFAAGNGGNGSLSNYDRYTNDYRVIAVGALEAGGQSSTYSEPGANVLISAPGTNMVTTDLVGVDGVSPTDYTTVSSRFIGTSAAAPVVSGVIALMLQANSRLTPRDVAWILAQTAAPVVCNECQGGSWLAASASANGFPPFSHKYGFGRVDAAAAVSLASAFTPVTAVQTCDSGWLTPGTAPQFSLRIPDNSSAGVSSSTTNLNNCNLTVDRIEVMLEASLASGRLTNYSGDLAVTLTSPSGALSTLARPSDCAGRCADISKGFTFSSVRHMGERAAGAWTLKVSDEQRNDESTFDRWRLVIHGH